MKRHLLLPISISALLGLSLLACSGQERSATDSTATGGASAAIATGGASNTAGTGGVAADAALGGVTSSGASSAAGGQSVTGSGGIGAAAAPAGTGGAPGSGAAQGVSGSGATATGGDSAGGSSGTGATPGSGGSTATGGSPASGGAIATGGSDATATGGSDASGGANATGGSEATGGSGDVSSLEKFSFFVASQEAIIRLSGSDAGFGGDLRYGEADGLAGADRICTEIAEASMPGSGAKVWRAFLSVTAGPDGNPVNAIDRIGAGPWYDRTGRVVALTKASLVATRPQEADTAIYDDLPNEYRVPNHAPDGTELDNHDILTGSEEDGTIGSLTKSSTCNDWTSLVGSTGKPAIGHSWSRGNRDQSWISAHTAPGCAAGMNVGEENGVEDWVGGSGGYGAIYCFALTP